MAKIRMLRVQFFYGWIIVFVSALGLFFSGPGQTYSVSVFIDSYIQEFGWSRSTISTLYSLATLVSGLLLFFTGRQIDRHGHRRVMPVITFLFSLVCLYMSRMNHQGMLFLGFFLIRFFGQGSMTLASSTLVPQWFIKKRGQAFSFMALGAVLGSTLLPPVNTYLIENYGWRTGWLFWALMLAVIMLPFALLLVKNRPEDMGLLPDNEIFKRDKKSGKKEWPSLTPEEARKTRSFWLILYCMFVTSMTNTGITFHLFSILGERGLSAMETATILSTMAAIALPSSFLAGFLLDRFKGNHIIALTFTLYLLVILTLIRVVSYEEALLFAALWGVCCGFENKNYKYIWPAYYGRLYLGSIRGTTMMAMVIGSAFGPLPFGFFYDLFFGYQEILGVMFFFSLLALFLSLQATSPRAGTGSQKIYSGS